MAKNHYRSLFRPTLELKNKLRTAHMSVSAKEFIRRNLTISVYLSVGLSVIVFFLTSRSKPSPVALALLPVFFFIIYLFLMQTPSVYIKRREREINRNLLFATRYMILKMDSGQPLFNSMISASKNSGIGGKFFQEIVDEVNLGKPIEKAIEDAHRYSPSRLFQMVLRQILNALRTGIDVSGSLRKLIDEITKEQQIEIKEYSKKLNSVVLFYLIMACVLPSLGISMFLIIGSMLNIVFNTTTYIIIFSVLLIVQLIFIGTIRSIKPMVEL